MTSPSCSPWLGSDRDGRLETTFNRPCSRPFAGKGEACQWAAAFVDWYVHQHRHSAIRFVTPQQRHSGQAPAICHQRTQVYEQARERHPRSWSRSRADSKCVTGSLAGAESMG